MIKNLFIEAEKQNEEKVSQDPWRLSYHLMPPVGWLNDPNGLCQQNGIYHIYYQYSPMNPLGDKKGWGHYTTKDFRTYDQEETALFPDTENDKDGAYSGSALKKDGILHYFYTGNIKFPGEHDYINSGRGHYTITFTSGDGKNFSEKKAVLKNEDYPEDISCHVRDPKVIFHNGQYYMVLGARTKDSRGLILVYQSKDLDSWEYLGRLNPQEDYGYMLECPDVFDLDGQEVLITCPQGMEQKGWKYENIYQNGYFLLDKPVEELPELHDFQELDHGFDFYAPQTFEDEKGRRILIGWMGIPDADYTNPTIARGWQHALTLPRELHVRNNHLYQYPLDELKQLRTDEEKIELQPDTPFHLGTQTFELHLDIDDREFELQLRRDCRISWKNGLLTLSFQESGYGRDARHVQISSVESLDIFSDTSSLEIFINHGQYALTSRVYDDKEDCTIVSNIPLSGRFYALKGFVIQKVQD